MPANTGPPGSGKGPLTRPFGPTPPFTLPQPSGAPPAAPAGRGNDLRLPPGGGGPWSRAFGPNPPFSTGLPVRPPAPVVLLNNFNMGTAGTSLSPGNTGDAADNAFDVVTIGSSATVAFDNSIVHPASPLSCKFALGGVSAQASADWRTTTLSRGPYRTMYYRLYVYVTANPTQGMRLCRAIQGTSLCAGLVLNSSGTLGVLNQSNSGIATTVATVPLNQWFRVEGFFTGDAAAGQGQVMLFKNADAPFNSPDEVQTSLPGQATLGLIDGMSLGMPTSATVFGPWWAANWGVSSYGYLGPVPVPAPVPFAPARRPRVVWVPRRPAPVLVPAAAPAAPPVPVTAQRRTAAVMAASRRRPAAQPPPTPLLQPPLPAPPRRRTGPPQRPRRAVPAIPVPAPAPPAPPYARQRKVALAWMARKRTAVAPPPVTVPVAPTVPAQPRSRVLAAVVQRRRPAAALAPPGAPPPPARRRTLAWAPRRRQPPAMVPQPPPAPSVPPQRRRPAMWRRGRPAALAPPPVVIPPAVPAPAHVRRSRLLGLFTRFRRRPGWPPIPGAPPPVAKLAEVTAGPPHGRYEPGPAHGRYEAGWPLGRYEPGPPGGRYDAGSPHSSPWAAGSPHG